MGHKTRKENHIAKIIVEVPEDKHTAFKTVCSSQGLSMKEVVEQFVDTYIKTHRKVRV